MAIQQKLHARLVQKLILTPSLQQAIKLLPMTTIELAELLNQEMVENPMLEEVPAEDPVQEATPAEQAEEQKKDERKDDTWDDQDYEYFFGEYLDDGYRPRQPQEVKELPPIENTLSSKGSLVGSPDVAVEPSAERSGRAGHRRRHHWQPRRGWLPRGLGQRDRDAWRLGRVRGRTGPRVRAVVRPGWRGRTRPAGVPADPDPSPRSCRHAGRGAGPRSFAPAAEPQVPGTGSCAGDRARRSQAAHRGHQAPRSEARLSL